MKFRTRKKAEDFLRDQGIPVGKDFLAQAAAAGTGPEYQYLGRHTLYREDNLLDWIKEGLSAPMRSPSDAAKRSWLRPTSRRARPYRKRRKQTSASSEAPAQELA